MSDTTAKKDIQKLQRAIVDGLEDVKAQDIQVFNTEHLSPLFERVIVASGSSNRQTKALAASVRDKVREGGFAKPRVEGEDNGEWIIVDCGSAVAHIMQPAIRQYYRLEEIWGDKPVRLKNASAKAAPKVARASKAAKTTQAEAAPAAKTAAKAAGKTPAKKPGAAQQATAAAKTTARKTPAQKAVAKTAAKAPARKTAVAKTPAKTATKTSAKSAVKATAKTPARKTAAGKAAAPQQKLVVKTGPAKGGARKK